MRTGARTSATLVRKGRHMNSRVTEALELLLHMVRVVSDGNKPDKSDIGRVLELIDEIKRLPPPAN